ncbi:MAG: DUF1015 domain-containing protein [Clostridia bacterium]|nr:DUF1015 domain-containing protein [Clostridia bacterium]
MARIVPIRGLHYSHELLRDLPHLVAPPYDVIDANLQDSLYHSHPYNVIRLEYGKTYPDDTETNNRYTRARELYQEWLAKKVLVQDKDPSLYFLEENFKLAGRSYRRLGIICGLGTDGYGPDKVLAHEATFAAPKLDRLELLKATHTNFSPIFGLYDDPQGRIASIIQQVMSLSRPMLEFEEYNTRIFYRLWATSSPQIIQQISEAFTHLPVLIADGHHRYETACRFFEYMQAQGEAGHDRVLAFLASINDPGLIVLPTHRLLADHCLADSRDAALRVASQYFQWEVHPLDGDAEHIIEEMRQVQQQGRNVIGLYQGGDQWYLLRLKGSPQNLDCMPKDKSQAWTKLDVAILHQAIIKPLLSDSSAISFTHDTSYAIRAVRDQWAAVAFLLCPPSVQQIMEVALHGDCMPEKSTYFYPKPLSGLIMNRNGF